jgi:hypothetical protein
MEIGVGTSIDQFAESALRLCTVLWRAHTILVGSNELHIIIVRKSVFEIGNGIYLVRGYYFLNRVTRGKSIGNVCAVG